MLSFLIGNICILLHRPKKLTLRANQFYLNIYACKSIKKVASKSQNSLIVLINKSEIKLKKHSIDSTNLCSKSEVMLKVVYGSLTTRIRTLISHENIGIRNHLGFNFKVVHSKQLPADSIKGRILLQRVL